MVFSSLIFLCVFLPFSLIFHQLIPGIRGKNLLLLIVSLLFYAYGEPVYLLLLIFSALLNYICAIGCAPDRKGRKAVLFLAVTANLTILGVFKYAAMITTTVNSIFSLNVPVPQIALPIGISFFTFQAMSYVIDVYRGDVCVQKDFSKVLLYISFFPQLIAGPILKYKDVSNFIDDRHTSAEGIENGLKRFIYGLAKKVFIANTVGAAADMIFAASAHEIYALTAWIAVLLYAIQLYYDFSGYSDMAIGLGEMFGFKIHENFMYPYSSSSMTVFWRRWHISLSTWFKEYLYIPLGGNRKGALRKNINRLLVFFCTGLWHGASWNFVLWGLYHGLFLLLEDVTGRIIKKPEKGILRLTLDLLGLIYVNAVWLVSMTFFRADSFDFARLLLKNMFTGTYLPLDGISLAARVMTPSVICAFIVGCILSFPVWPKIKQHFSENKVFAMTERVFTFLLLLLVIAHLSGTSYNPFIYFRF